MEVPRKGLGRLNMRGGKVKVVIIPLVFDTRSTGAVPWRFIAFLNLGPRLQGNFLLALQELCRSPNLTTLDLTNISGFPIKVITACPNL